MRRRMSIHCSTIRMAAASGALTPAQGLVPVVMLLEPFMVPTIHNSTITSIHMEAIMVVATTTLAVITEYLVRQVLVLACWIPLPVEAKPFTAIRTAPVRRSSRMNLHCRLTLPKLQAIVGQQCPPRSVRKPPAILEHHHPVRHPYRSSNTTNSNRICSLEDRPPSVVHRTVIQVHHFNSNSSKWWLPSSSISNLNRVPSPHRTSRT